MIVGLHYLDFHLESGDMLYVHKPTSDSRNLTPKQQCQNTTQHFGEPNSPIFGGLAQLRGGSGGRPLCKATTAEPLHTV